MSRHASRSMLGLAMLLVGTGAECVRAKLPIDEQEQRRMKWASDRAVSRMYSVEEMRQYLRSAGDDEAKADDYLPQLDELTRKAGGSRALQLVDMQLRHMKKQAPNEVIYQEYQDGKLTYEVTAPPAQIRALGMPPVMLIRPLDCPEAPRPPAKPRSKSGQRRAHVRWGR